MSVSVNNGAVHFDEDELLSAYLDGEVTEAERAAVVARLARDPAARALLEELQALSSALHTLPRDPAPVELQAAALQALSLASFNQAPGSRPAQQVLGSSGATATRPLKWFRRRELVAGFTAIAATVLVTALLPWTLPGNRNEVLDDSLLVAHDSLEATRAGTVWMDNETENVALGIDKSGNETSLALSESATFTKAMHSDSTSTGVAADSVAAKRLPGLMTAKTKAGQGDAQAEVLAAVVPETDRLDALVRLEPWQEIQPYLNLINQNSGVVTNFDMHVIDTVQAADQFQVLLMQNGMAVADADTERASGQTMSGKRGLNRSQNSGDEPVLVGVYIEADNTEPVTRSLESLARQNTLVGLKLQPPLQMPEDVVTNSFGRPGQRRSSEPADEQLANGLIDAYIDVQYNFAAADIVALAPVSALSALPGSQELARLGDGLNSPVPMPPGTRAIVADAETETKSTADRRQEAPVARYSQIVKVPQPVDWFAELQEQQQKTSGESPADLAFNKQLNFGSETEKNRMMQMKRELQANSAGRYRLFFVLKPSSTAAGLEGASAPDEPR